MVTKTIDLIFYKLFQAYNKKKDSPIYSSVLFMGLIRFSMLLFLGITMDLLLNIRLPFKKQQEILMFVAIIELPILIWTFYRYSRKGKIAELEIKFSDYRFHKIKSWHIFMLPIFFIILTLIMIFTFGNVVFLPGQ